MIVALPGLFSYLFVSILFDSKPVPSVANSFLYDQTPQLEYYIFGVFLYYIFTFSERFVYVTSTVDLSPVYTFLYITSACVTVFLYT